MPYLTNLTDTGDDLKYDEEQLKRANEWSAEAELDYDYRQWQVLPKTLHHPHAIYHNTNYRKSEKPGKYTFFRTNETYSTCQHVAIETSKHQRFYNTSNWSGYICLVKK